MKTYFSKKGYNNYLEKIEKLDKKVRIIAKTIKEEAGDRGEFHDNFGYEQATRMTEALSRNLKELVERVKNKVEIITPSEQNKKIAIGNTVTYYTTEYDTTKEITIGAFNETDPSIMLVSYEAPLAKVFIGKEEGNEMKVIIGGKELNIEIEEIFPPSYKYNKLIDILTNTKND